MSDEVREKDKLEVRRPGASNESARMPDEDRTREKLEEQLRHLEDKAAIVLGVAGGVGAALLNIHLPDYLLKLGLPTIDLLHAGAWIAVVTAVWLALNGIAGLGGGSSDTSAELGRAVSGKATLIESSIRCLSISVAFLALEYVWPPSRLGEFPLLFLASGLGGAITVILRSAEAPVRPAATTLWRYGGILLAGGASAIACWLLSLATWHGISLALAGCLVGSQIAEIGSYIVSRIRT